MITGVDAPCRLRFLAYRALRALSRVGFLACKALSREDVQKGTL